MEATSEQNTEKRDHVSLLAFNVHAWGDAKHKANFSRVMEILHLLQPDVIGLNEVRSVLNLTCYGLCPANFCNY